MEPQRLRAATAHWLVAHSLWAVSEDAGLSVDEPIQSTKQKEPRVQQGTGPLSHGGG